MRKPLPLGSIGLVPPEVDIEIECGGKEKRSVVVIVIPDEIVRDRSLGGGGDYRRVRVDRAQRRVEPRIRDPRNADFSVVVGNVVKEPFDRIVGIRRFVGIARLFVRIDGTQLDPFAFRIPSAANILIHEDIIGQFPGSERPWIVVLAVRAAAVGGPRQENRINAGGIARCVHGGK